MVSKEVVFGKLYDFLLGKRNNNPIVRLGQETKILKSYLAQTTGLLFGENSTSSGLTVIPYDVSKYKNKGIFIRNATDKTITVTIKATLSNLVNTYTNPSFSIVTNHDLLPGTEKIWQPTNTPDMGGEMLGLIVFCSVATPTGSYDVYLLGS